MATTKTEQDTKAADKSKNVDAPTQQTTKQEADKSADVPTSPVEAETQPVEDEGVTEATDGFEGAAGTTSERDWEGNEYDAPFTYLTAQDLARTSDWDDPARSWVAQEVSEREDPVALVDVQGTPGQTFRLRELPDRDVAEAAGVDYAQFVAGLPVRPDVPNEGARRGIPA